MYLWKCSRRTCFSFAIFGAHTEDDSPFVDRWTADRREVYLEDTLEDEDEEEDEEVRPKDSNAL